MIQDRENYACATRSSLPADRFHTKTGGRFVFTCILGDPGAVSRDDTMFVVKVYCKIEMNPWALPLTEPVPEAFELPASEIFLANQRREAAG